MSITEVSNTFKCNICDEGYSTTRNKNIEFQNAKPILQDLVGLVKRSAGLHIIKSRKMIKMIRMMIEMKMIKLKMMKKVLKTMK